MVDRIFAREPLDGCVEAAVAGGVDRIQLRERALDGAALLAWCRALSDAAHRGASRSGRPVEVIVNKRLDVALAIAADGIHLGIDALSVAAARQLLGNGARIGVSCHSAGEVAEARAAGADYAHLAPIFDPLSKAVERPALGTQALAAACLGDFPVIAQGGLQGERIPEVIRRGAAGVAVTGALLATADPGASAAQMRADLDRAAAIESA